jgi:hypothetical protein
MLRILHYLRLNQHTLFSFSADHELTLKTIRDVTELDLEDTLKCDECQKKFKTLTNLRVHVIH